MLTNDFCIDQYTGKILPVFTIKFFFYIILDCCKYFPNLCINNQSTLFYTSILWTSWLHFEIAVFLVNPIPLQTITVSIRRHLWLHCSFFVVCLLHQCYNIQALVPVSGHVSIKLNQFSCYAETRDNSFEKRIFKEFCIEN